MGEGWPLVAIFSKGLYCQQTSRSLLEHRWWCRHSLVKPSQLHHMPQVLRTARVLLQKASNCAGGSRPRKPEKEPAGEEPMLMASGLRWHLSAFWAQRPTTSMWWHTHTVRPAGACTVPGHTVFSPPGNWARLSPVGSWPCARDHPGSVFDFSVFPTDGPRLLALQELNVFLPSAVSYSPTHQLSEDSWGLLSP